MQTKKYKKKIVKVGNSMMVLIPSWFKEAYGIRTGDTVKIQLEKLGPLCGLGAVSNCTFSII